MSEEEVWSEEKCDELVEMIFTNTALCKLVETLPILSSFVKMVFLSERTKQAQLSLIKSCLKEQREEKEDLAKENPYALGIIGAINLVEGLVDTAFGYSTYSAKRREQFIVSGIRDIVKEEEVKIENIKQTLKEFYGESDD